MKTHLDFNQNKYDLNIRLKRWTKILIMGIILEFFLRHKLYDLGIDIIEVLQYKIKNNFLIITFFQILSQLANKSFIVALTVISFNYLDMYSTSILVMMIGLSSGSIGLFKIIYKNPRPYFHEDWVEVYDCETGYGNPSGHSLLAVSLYLTLWKIIKKRFHFFENNKKRFFPLLLILIFLIIISRLALGAHSLNQVILGSFLGYQIYSFLFKVLKIDLHVKEEIRILTDDFHIKLTTCIILIFLAIGFFVFNYFPIELSLNIQNHLERILINCPGTPLSKIFDNEALNMMSFFSVFFGAYFGIYFDVKYNLKNNHEEWIEMNTIDKMWNQTNFITGIKRLFLIISIILIPFSTNLLVSSNSDNTFLVFFFRNFIPFFFVAFLLFAVCRKISFNFGLVNQKFIKN